MIKTENEQIITVVTTVTVKIQRCCRTEVNSRDHSAVWAELSLVESVFAVLPHQVVRMRSVRLILRHQVNAHLTLPRVIHDLWMDGEEGQVCFIV